MYMQARKRCVQWGYRAELGHLRSVHAVTKLIFSRTVLEKLTKTGESPIGERGKSAWGDHAPRLNMSDDR